MFRLVVLTCVIAAGAAQVVDPKDAKILKEQRFNAGDGRAGSAFATENGVIFKEESDNAGNRIGQYSYIGDDGKTYTVKYSAGKDGFRILGGDHIPSGGQGAAAFVAEPVEEPLPVAPQPDQRAFQPLPAAPQQQQPRPAPIPIERQIAQPQIAQPQQPRFADYDDTPTDPNFNPFINPNDPTHLDFGFNKNAAKFNPNSPLAKQASLVPPCADCEGVNPFINPFDNTHRGGQAGLLAGHLAGHLAGAQRPAPAAPRRAQPLPAPLPAPQPVVPRQPLPALPTPSQAPKRFFPPGQLSLNRFETGFNFDFES